MKCKRFLACFLILLMVSSPSLAEIYETGEALEAPEEKEEVVFAELQEAEVEEIDFMLGADEAEIALPAQETQDDLEQDPEGEVLPGDDSFDVLSANESQDELSDQLEADGEVDPAEDFRIVGDCLTQYLGHDSDVVIPADLGIRTIGDYVFANDWVRSVVVPEGVTTIRSGAFSGYGTLESVELPDSLTTIGYGAFAHSTALKSIRIPDGVTRIESHLFSNCTSLESVTLPKSATIILDHAFYNCTSLRSIDLPDELTIIKKNAFQGCTALESITLPAGVTTIDTQAFQACTSLRSVSLPDGLISMRQAFEDCTSLVSIHVPDSVNDMAYAFQGCTALETVSAPVTVKSDSCVLRACRQLKSLTVRCPGNTVFNKYMSSWLGISGSGDIPQGLTITITGDMKSISMEYFANLSREDLTVVLPDDVETIERLDCWPDRTRFTAADFSRASLMLALLGAPGATYRSRTCPDLVLTLEDDMFIVTGYAGSGGRVTIPGNIEGFEVLAIGEGALSNQPGIMSLTVESGLRIIGDRALAGDTGLTEVTLAPGVVMIGESAFEGDTALRRVALPGSLTTIGSGAFRGCAAIEDMTLPRSVSIYGSDTLAGHVRVFAGTRALLYCQRNSVDFELIAVESLTLSREKAILAPGKKLTLSATLSPDGTGSELSFASSNTKVATVSAVGVVTAKKAGTATITAKADGATARCEIRVGNLPKKVTLKAVCTDLGIGDEVPLTVRFDGSAVAEVSFTSANEDVVTVDPSTGLVTAVGAGRAYVTVRTSNKKTARLLFNVTEPATGLDMPAECALAKGTSLKLAATPIGGAAAVRYRSSDENVATVDATGTVKGISGGTAVITASTRRGIELPCTVTVNAAAIDAEGTTVAVGDSLALSLSHVPGTDVTWKVSSSKPKIARVSQQEGIWRVTGVKAGAAVITATASTGAKATLKVTVKKKAKSGTLVVPARIGVGESFRLTAKSNTGAYVSILEIETDPAEQDYITVAGRIATGAKAGTVMLRARLTTGWTGWTTLEISEAPTSDNMRIVLDSDNTAFKTTLPAGYGARQDYVLRVARGDSANLHLEYRNGTSGSWTARSTNEDVVRLDGSKACFVGLGVATVVFTAYNGAETSLDFEVLPAPKKVSILADSAVTCGYDGAAILTTDRGLADLEHGLVDIGYDYLHMTMSVSDKNLFTLGRLSDDLAPQIISLRQIFSLHAGAKIGSAKLTVKLFNGVSAKQTIKTRANKITVNSKPTKADIKACAGGVAVYLKSLEIKGGNLIAECYVINGTNRNLSGRLFYDEQGCLWIGTMRENGTVNGKCFASKWLNSLKVTVNKKSYKTFKVTYSLGSLSSNWPYGNDVDMTTLDPSQFVFSLEV